MITTGDPPPNYQQQMDRILRQQQGMQQPLLGGVGVIPQAAVYKDPILAKLDAMHTDQAMAAHDTAERLARIEQKLDAILDALIPTPAAPQPCRPDGLTSGERFAQLHGLAIMRAIREVSR